MIKYIDFYIPEERVSVETVFDALKTDTLLHPSFETKDDGIAFFKYVLNLHEVSDARGIPETNMLSPLMSRLFESGLVRPSDVELIILIGDELNQGSRIANLGHYLQYTYNMEGADVMNLSGNHCANVEYAVCYGENILSSGTVNNILIIAVNELLLHEDRLVGSYALKGDGAGLVFLEPGTSGGIKLHGKFSVTTGILYKADVNAANTLMLCKNYTSCLSGLMNKYQLKPADISHIIIQNANPTLISQCLQSIGFKTGQLFLDNLSSFGHLDCIDFLINLKSVAAKNLAPATKIISFGTGWAGSQIALYMETV